MKIFPLVYNFFVAVSKRTINTFLDLFKIILPVYTLVYILSLTPVLKIFADFLRPAMKYFGLPGESALALILGNFINLYAAIGVIPLLKLSPHQVTTIALMLLTSHSQILETSVFIKLKTRFIILLFLRIIIAIIGGYVFAHL
ncbi:MAG: nucleoside recognition domain-containing protein [candidate division WOR-3 bacterium]